MKKWILSCLKVSFFNFFKSFKGHDTTSSGLAWSLWCLAHNLDCQQRVIEEIDLIFGTFYNKFNN